MLLFLSVILVAKYFSPGNLLCGVHLSKLYNPPLLCEGKAVKDIMYTNIIQLYPHLIVKISGYALLGLRQSIRATFELVFLRFDCVYR